ncbi:hypothetical protein DUI87_35530 [Hirundo rustica rustica]|uniref:Uncharacterized protein n=1 Tax=Hirundo rustica rustica TaxID=333673 RepID=A0A3M0IH65_HIRRU|nr:hypothetical protein DUI87_35530 [Hirundo rustica rustica]
MEATGAIPEGSGEYSTWDSSERLSFPRVRVLDSRRSRRSRNRLRGSAGIPDPRWEISWECGGDSWEERSQDRIQLFGTMGIGSELIRAESPDGSDGSDPGGCGGIFHVGFVRAAFVPEDPRPGFPEILESAPRVGRHSRSEAGDLPGMWR